MASHRDFRSQIIRGASSPPITESLLDTYESLLKADMVKRILRLSAVEIDLLLKDPDNELAGHRLSAFTQAAETILTKENINGKDRSH